MKKSILFIILICTTIISAQGNLKFPVEVSHSGIDIVGGRLAFAIKERIRKSESLQLSYSQELRIVIILITLDQYKDQPGTSSCYSFTLCLDDPNQLFRYYITSSVGYCGSSRVDEVAEGFVADTDKEIERLLKLANQSQPNK